MMTKEEKVVNKLLCRLKINAYKLKESGSLPLFLYLDICRLGIDTDIALVRDYMDLTEKYLRIKGFYFKYPEIQEVYKEEVRLYLKERSEKVDD